MKSEGGMFNVEEIATLLHGRFGVSSVTGDDDVIWLTYQLNKLVEVKEDDAPFQGILEKLTRYDPDYYKYSPVMSEDNLGGWLKRKDVLDAAQLLITRAGGK